VFESSWRHALAFPHVRIERSIECRSRGPHAVLAYKKAV